MVQFGGKFSGAPANQIYPMIDYSYTQNIAQNTSTVTAILYFVKLSSSWSSYNNGGHTVTINVNGNGSANRTFDLRNSSRQEIWRRTVTVQHGSDGKKSITIGASGNTGVLLGTYNFSQSVALPTIPRAYNFIVSETTHEMDTPLTVKITDNGSGLTAKLRINFGGATVYYPVTAIGTNFTITPKSSDFAPKIPTANSGWGGIHLETYSGSALIGTTSVSPFTMTIPSSVVPTMGTITHTDESNVPTVLGIAKTSGMYLQNLSLIRFSATAIGIYGSTITSYKVECDGLNLGTSKDVNLKTVDLGSGAKTIKITATDSRNRTVSKTLSVTITAYSPPKINTADVVRVNNGTVLKFTKSATVSSIKIGTTEKNTWTSTTEMKLSQDNIWETIKTETNAFTNVNIDGFGIANSYDIKMTIADKFSSASTILSVSTATALISLYRDIGIGVGKMYEPGHGTLDVDGDIYLNGVALFNMFYPVGSIYQSTNSTSPSTFMGGTWERYGKGKVLVSLDEADADFATVGKTGGEKEHTLTIAEMPSHAHQQEGNGGGDKATGFMTPLIRDANGGNAYVNNNTKPTGGGGAHNNLQPYQVVYTWRRTA